MKKLLKTLSSIAMFSITAIAVQAQDPDAFLHVQFENNLNASTTEAGGVTFAVSDPNSEGFLTKYNSSTPKEGSSALELTYAFDPVTFEFTENVSLIDNSSNVQIESTTNLAILGNAARTFAAWIRFDNLSTGGGSHVILNMGDPTSSSQGRVTWTFAAGNDRMQIAIGGGNVNGNYDPNGITSPNLEDGAWHHVAFTYAAGAVLDDIIFYIDGVPVTNDGGSNSDTVGFSTVTAPLYIGSRGNNSLKWFDGGGIDDLRVYDSALTSAEIATIFGGAFLSLNDVAFGEGEIKAFPNSVEDVLQIQTTNNNSLEINVFDISGKAIIRTSGNSVDMSALTSGLYIVRVRDANKVANLKILKK